MYPNHADLTIAVPGAPRTRRKPVANPSRPVSVPVSPQSSWPIAASISQQPPLPFRIADHRRHLAATSLKLIDPACSAFGGQAALPQEYPNPPCHPPITVAVVIGTYVFSALLDAGATNSCLTENIRRRLHKVITPPNPKHFLRMGNGQLVQPRGYCTASIQVGRNNYVVQLMFLAYCISDIFLGCDILFATEAFRDCGSRGLRLSITDVIDNRFSYIARWLVYIVTKKTRQRSRGVLSRASG